MKDYLLSYANRDLPAFNKEYQVAIEAGRKQSNNEGIFNSNILNTFNLLFIQVSKVMDQLFRPLFSTLDTQLNIIDITRYINIFVII